MQEIWKDIIGHEGYYQISNFGRVKRLSIFVKRPGNKSDMILNEKILTFQTPKEGRPYSEILNRSTKRRDKISIDRTVAKYFLDNPKNATWVKHKDGNVLNCNVNNLEWINPRERKTKDYNLEKELLKSEKFLPIDFSYIAGAMDADGCFTININHGKKAIHYIPFIQIAQIDRETIDFIKERFEFNEYKQFTHSRNGSISRRFYRIVMAGIRTEAFLIRIIPYLKIKKKQAKCLLDLCQLMKAPDTSLLKVKINRKKGKTYFANFPVLSGEHINKQHYLYEQVRKYNRREK
jgi:hypothetical protein